MPADAAGVGKHATSTAAAATAASAFPEIRTFGSGEFRLVKPQSTDHFIHEEATSRTTRVEPSIRNPCRASVGRLVQWFTIKDRLVLLTAWYLGLLTIAIVSKYLDTGWGNLLKIPRSAHAGPLGQLLRAGVVSSRLFHVYRADIVQTFLLLVAIVVVGYALARIPLSLLSWMSLFAAAVMAFAEWLSLRETGLPLTYGNLVVSIDWAREHPAVIASVLPWSSIIGVLVVAALYGGAPTILRRLSLRHRDDARHVRLMARLVACAVIAAVVGSCATQGASIHSMTQTMSPVDGFWSSSIASLANIDRASPNNLPAETALDISESYRRIEYPMGVGRRTHGATLVKGDNMLRHVVIIVLETAPRKYYPLASDSSYRTFNRMAAHSLVSTRHFTNRPQSLFAMYGILTGTYPRPGVPIGEYGTFRPDGLASVLGARGYESTYIDSYKVDWGYHYRSELKQRGFQTILDTAGFRPPPARDPFTTAVAREKWSLAEALGRVRSAQLHGRKALVVVATTLGHFPWRSDAAMASASSADKLRALSLQIDTAVGTFIHGLDSLRLRDSVIVVVTGDHGLRYAAEFESLGYRNSPGSDLEFNVPFMMYAPGIFKYRIDVPYATSHVDVAPTLYYLLGVPTDTLLLHGENMLDPALARGRAIFLMNTGLYPVNGFLLDGYRYISNQITTESAIGPEPSGADTAYRWSGRRIRALLDSADRSFNRTAAQFLHRR